MSFARTFALLVAAVVVLGAGMASAVSIPIPDGSFESDSTGYCFASLQNTGGTTMTSPVTATLSGWDLTFNPITAHGGVYTAWEPYGVVVNNSGQPVPRGSASVGTQFFDMYPGEPYDGGYVVSGPQPGASLVMTTTGISSSVVAGGTYTASISARNTFGNNENNGPNVALNILANGQVVGTGTGTVGKAGTGWQTFTATWTADAGHAGQAIELQVVANNFLEGSYPTDEYVAPSFGIDNATLSVTGAPEPATLTMLITGLIGLLAYAWRRRRA